MRSVLLIAVISLMQLPLDAKAEYRAYELAIVHEPTGQTRIVLSTLDDLQYVGYYPLNAGERVEIRSHWMCWGRSDHFKSICPNPNPQVAPAIEAGPTANLQTPAPAAP